MGGYGTYLDGRADMGLGLTEGGGWGMVGVIPAESVYVITGCGIPATTCPE